MSRQALVEYITGLLVLYKSSSKSQKTLLLNQAQTITGKSRRTIQRYMAQTPGQTPGLRVKIEGRGRLPIYPPILFLPHIRVLWKAMEMISAERMVEALPKWLPYYTEASLTPELREKILSMSRCTLERLIALLRSENQAKRGLSTTSSALRAFKTKIPINTLDHSVTKPGYTQADTVAHCGNTTAGVYLNTLTLTDIFSGWTVNRALPNKKALSVRRALVDLKKGLPFKLLGVNSDSGSEFINEQVFELLNPNPVFSQKDKILFTRSRPYKKNDNCYVEQRNFTHVRQLFGYYRYEDPTLVGIMNEIYEQFWNPLHNFFLPSQKLVEKSRVGSKTVKRHDVPQTPADRLLASTALEEDQKQTLRKGVQNLNPFELSQGLERRLKLFFDLHRQTTTQKEVA